MNYVINLDGLKLDRKYTPYEDNKECFKRKMKFYYKHLCDLWKGEMTSAEVTKEYFPKRWHTRVRYKFDGAWNFEPIFEEYYGLSDEKVAYFHSNAWNNAINKEYNERENKRIKRHREQVEKQNIEAGMRLRVRRNGKNYADHPVSAKLTRIENQQIRLFFANAK